MSVVEVFDAAVDVPEAEREAFLQRACGGDETLLRKVKALLKAHNRPSHFLDRPSARERPEGGRVAPIGEKAGDQIGRYNLLQQIGEGGWGVVFMAEQREPVRRRVALKIVKPGMDTKSVVARFEAERQALALMDHPNIAHVLDAGTTDHGRPYFVMELVQGIKMTDYCDHNNLPTAARLELFLQVCDAAQHAHQKGIIHRDLKPSNILVTTSPEGKPLPKVIDFGIAKATAGVRLTDKSLFTAFDMLIGTPAYMSPEQAAMTNVEVDTRTDIYSLGVLLYELLTGTTPFDTQELLKVGLDELRRVIREQDPLRPSTRLSTMAKADLTPIARCRKAEAPKLIRAVRGDLDWIVMMALEKDRARRYQTANGLALDIQRYLANETILARPPSRLYKLQKAVLRNKILFTGIGVFGVLVVLSLIVVSLSFAKERRSAVKSQQATKFLEEMLNGVGPSFALGRDTSVVRQILDQTDERLGKEMTNQPEIRAELGTMIGRLYRQIGNFDKAEEMERAALAVRRERFGPESHEAAATLNELGLALLSTHKLSEAQAVDGEALAIRRHLFGNENADTATSMNDLSAVYREEGKLAEAEPMAREALEIRRKLFGDEHLDVADSRRNLSIILGDEGKWAESEALAREVLATRRKLLPSEHPWLASALDDVAWAAGARGNLDEAEKLEREALAMRRKLLPENHPDVAESLYLVGDRMRQRGNVNEAIPILNSALSIQRKLLGEDNPAVLYTLNSMGSALEQQRNWSELETVRREALGVWRRRSGGEDPQTLNALENLGTALEAEGKWSEAESVRREALVTWRKCAREDDKETLFKLRRLGFTLEGQGKWPEAEILWRESLGLWRKRAGEEDKETLYTLEKLVSALGTEGKWTEAETIRREALTACRRSAGDQDPKTLYALRRLGLTLEEAGKWAEAETLWRESLPMWRKRGGVDEKEAMYTLRKLGIALEAEGKWTDAEAVHREALAVSRKKEGNEGQEALADLERLVHVLLKEKNLGEAEQLLGQVLTPALASRPSSVNLLIERVDVLGRQRRWREATGDAELLLQIQPTDHYNYHRLAGLLAITHDHPAYEQICQRLLTNFANPTDPYVAERMVQDCLLLPHSRVDLESLDKLADVAVTVGKSEGATPYFQACKAMANYRRGHFPEAIEWAEEATKSSLIEAQAKAYAVAAMAHWQLGQKDAARAALAEGDKLEPNLLPANARGDIGESWVAWLFARVSLDEATALIQYGSTMDNNSIRP
jgi:serine/threonine protein kinase